MKNQILCLRLIVLFALSVFIDFHGNCVIAQDSSKAPIDTLKAKAKKESVPRDMKETAGTEISLDEIVIQAVVEKPRVSILPKRVEPDLSKAEFVDRSFENELKQIPKKPMFLGKDRQDVIKIKKIDVKPPSKEKLKSKSKKKDQDDLDEM
ncbi:hypothetical protein JXJ21_09705 [candidate division KSB1 bacterium]|nr:hypothetical protein [candidate division KSB1 bacterium]